MRSVWDYVRTGAVLREIHESEDSMATGKEVYDAAVEIREALIALGTYLKDIRDTLQEIQGELMLVRKDIRTTERR